MRPIVILGGVVNGAINRERSANAKTPGFAPVNQNGETMYCRIDLKTGSHLNREST
jgi:hypothetical protein